MWILLAVLVAVTFAAILLAPKPKMESARASSLEDVQYPRAKEGDPVPIIFGTVRLRSPNTIWYGDFEAQAITERVQTGLFTSKKITKGYRYYLGLDLALCLGDGSVKLKRIWAGKEIAWEGNDLTDAQIGAGAETGYSTKTYDFNVTGRTATVLLPATPLLVTGVVRNPGINQTSFPTPGNALTGGYIWTEGTNIVKITLGDADNASVINPLPIRVTYRTQYVEPPAPPIDATNGNIYINKPDLFGGDEKRGGLRGYANFYGGAFTQQQDPYLVAKLGADVPRYGGICHIVFNHFYWGTTTSLEALNFELQRETDYLQSGKGVMPNGLDSNPVEVLYDALTSKWGRLGVSPEMIDLTSWRAAAVTCYNEGNGISFVVGASNTGKEIAEEVLRQIDGVMYQDPVTGKIILKLIRADYNEAELPTFDQSTIKELRSFSKSTWEGTYNQVRVKFENRDKAYTEAIAMVQDTGNISFQGRVKSSLLSMPGVKTPDNASAIATRSLAMMSVPLFKCELFCTRAAGSLRPGQPFRLTWAPFGLTNMVMRVQRLDLGELTNGLVRVMAIQDKFSVQSMLFAPPEPGEWTNPVDNPAAILVRKVVEAPYFILASVYAGRGSTVPAGQSGILSVAKKPTNGSLNYDAVVSSDGWVTKVYPMDDALYGGTARLVNNLAESAGQATGALVSLVIDQLDDPTVLRNSTTAAAREGAALFLVNNEFFVYTGFTDHGNGSYTLNGLYRGILDTARAEHAAGDRVFFIQGSENLFETLFPLTATVKSKLLDNTAHGTYTERLAVEDTTVLDSRSVRPLPPDYVTVNTQRYGASVSRAGGLTIAWKERNRLNPLIMFPEDPTETPEAGTTYRVRTRWNSGAWTEYNGDGTPSYAFDAGGSTTGTLDVEVYAVRGGLTSMTPDRVTVNVTN